MKPRSINGITDPSKARLVYWGGTEYQHAPADNVGYQPYDETHIDVEARYGGAATDNIMLQNALDDAELGSVLHFPLRTMTITDPLVMTRFMHIRARGAFLNGSGLGAGEAILRIKISTAGTGNAARRGMTIQGGNWYTASGDYAIHISEDGTDTLGLPLMNLMISDGLFEGATAGIRIEGMNNHFCKIDNNYITNGVWLDGTADGNEITRNVISGDQPAVLADIVTGAAETLIAYNALVSSSAAVDILNGSQINIVYNQIEQIGTHVGSPSAHVIIRGSDATRIPQCNRIMHNNLGGGSNVDTAIYIVKAEDTIIDGNSFKHSDVRDIFFDTDARYNKVGFNNHYRGIRAAGDPTRKALITDNGVGNAGFWKPSTDITFSNGWTAGSAFEFMSLDGRCWFEGTLVPGTLTAGTTIMTLPLGFRPRVNFIVPVTSNSGITKTLLITAAGVVSANETLAGTAVYMGPISFPTMWKNAYTEGPV